MIETPFTIPADVMERHWRLANGAIVTTTAPPVDAIEIDAEELAALVAESVAEAERLQAIWPEESGSHHHDDSAGYPWASRAKDLDVNAKLVELLAETIGIDADQLAKLKARAAQIVEGN
jgi:hypothetical protein